MKGFTLVKNLSIAIIVKNSSGQFCDYSFAQKSDLGKHVFTVHENHEKPKSKSWKRIPSKIMKHFARHQTKEKPEPI